MTSPKISVVIPSYNKVKYIGQTIESIVSQGYPDYEVIIQDGGSTDGTLDIIKKFAKKCPREIKWESGKDKGQLDAINKGLSKASGEILTYINADDVYTSDAFRLVSEAYNKNHNKLWFAGEGKIINENGKEIAEFWTLLKNILLNINSYSLLIGTANYLVQPSVFISKRAFEKYGPFTGLDRYVFEYELWLKLGRVSMPVVISHTISKFRMGGANMTSEFANSIFAKDMEIVRKYSTSPLVVFFHWINNNIRLLVNKFV